MRKSKNRWWNAVDLPTVPLTKELFEKFLKEYRKTPPEYFYLIEKKKEKKVKAVKVFENYLSRLLCALFDTPALTLGRYILLGCYKDRYETLLHETTHYYCYYTTKWYLFKYIWKLIRK